jgi:hypothetical protein
MTDEGGECWKGRKTMILFKELWDSAAQPLERHNELARYVLEGVPAIEQLVKEAEALLQADTGDKSFDAYVSGDPDRVDAQVKSIYDRLRTLGLTYRVEPWDSHHTVQRIRLADEVLEKEEGCCVDLVLLLAGCLAHVRLRPLILIVGETAPGHAVLGYWLEEKQFTHADGSSRSILDANAFLSARNDIHLVEATDLADPAPPDRSLDFQKAQSDAASHLPPNLNQRVWFVVDVAACRRLSIEPLKYGRSSYSFGGSPPPVPLPPPTFVGRERETEELRAWLTAGGVVALTGLGGVGKTALAQRVAQAMQPHFVGGTAWVNCETAPSLGGILSEMAVTLIGEGARQLRPDEQRQAVDEALRRRPCLIVLDNFETIAQDGEVLEFLKTVAAPSGVLLTSRENVPHVGARTKPLDELPSEDAVRLFTTLARDAGAHVILSGAKNLGVRFFAPLRMTPAATGHW